MKIECEKHKATIELDGGLGTVDVPGARYMFIWHEREGITRSMLNYGEQTLVTDLNAEIRAALAEAG